MAVPTTAGFTEMAKLGTGTGSAAAFKYMALGTGTGQTAASTTLSAESTASGLARVDATEATSAGTMSLVHTFTAGASAHIKEVGWFNKATSGGDMLMVGDLSESANMVKDDTLKVTLTCEIKAGA
jgi:hypothetical protein